MQIYSNPNREHEPTALPDVEVFYMSESDIEEAGWNDDYSDQPEEGFYYWYCFPGCLPDSLPIGPFETEQEAIANAQGE